MHRPRRCLSRGGGDRVRRTAIEPRVADVAQPPARIFRQAQLQQMLARQVCESPDGRYLYAAVAENGADIVMYDGLI